MNHNTMQYDINSSLYYKLYYTSIVLYYKTYSIYCKISFYIFLTDQYLLNLSFYILNTVLHSLLSLMVVALNNFCHLCI